MPARGTILCHMCGQFKPRDEFFSPSGTYLGMCTRCAVYGMDTAFIARIRGRYGLTAIEYCAMLLRQHGLCAVCEKFRPLHVDHCHITGKVRGLVCVPCNTGMGHFQHDPVLLRAAADHIEEHMEED
jgi:hypothetical protein